jgi:hypothetical protein
LIFLVLLGLGTISFSVKFFKGNDTILGIIFF